MKKLLTPLVLLLLVLRLPAQTVQQKLDELMTAYAKTNKFNGSVLVARKGNILLEKGYGYSNAETKLPNNENGIYQIGSVTKQFTSAIIMQLQEEKKLSVTDKLSKYFPGFPNGDRITIEHLLTHTSGLYNYTRDTAIMNKDVTRPYSADEMISQFKKYPPDFEPGSSWSYSNSGYSMLGYIIQKVSGKPYEQVVRERILHPLGMTHSGFDFTHLNDPNKTKGYFALAGNNVAPAPVVDSTIAYSAGALYATVEDLYKWERAITAGRLLKPESWKAVFTPVKNKYGYGWGIDTLFGQTFMSHSGGIHGYSSYILRFPQEEVTVILMDNSSSKTLGKIGRDLAAATLDKPYTVPEAPKVTSVAPEILKTYVGEYELQPGFTITITREGNQLIAQATGQSAFELYPEKENLFFLKVVEAKVEFVRNEKGEVTELILYQGGQKPRGKKIK